MVTEDVARGLGVGELTSRLLSILRWPALFLVLTGSVALLYRYGPSVTVPWRWILIGAGAFAAGWLIATAALGYYVGNGANYGATYGSLGAVIVLMTWFFVTGALLMTGAEITAALVHELTPDAIHRRGAEQAVAGAVDDATSGIVDRGLRGGSPGDRLGS
jgi:membrane protein